jgi:hypothetical protein
MRKIEWKRDQGCEHQCAEITAAYLMTLEAFWPDARDVDGEWTASISAFSRCGFVSVRMSGRGPTLADALSAAESRLRETCPGVWTDYASRVMVGDGVAA